MGAHNDAVIQQEVDILYSLSLVIDKMLMDVERRLSVRSEGSNREKKQAFSKVCDGIQRAYKGVEKLNLDIEKASASTNYTELDIWHMGANEICRLLLLYFEKCEYVEENANQVFKFLRSLTSGKGIVDEEVLERFYLKK